MSKKKRTMMLRLLSGALGLLGFAACNNNEEEEELLLMYGSPYTKFQVKGTVTSEANEPLKGIQVIVRKLWDNNPMWADTLYTDEKGEFQTQESRFGGINEQKVYFHDIDGEENGGTFKSDSIALKDMDMKQIEKGDNNWYNGKYEFTPKHPVKLSKDN